MHPYPRGSGRAALAIEELGDLRKKPVALRITLGVALALALELLKQFALPSGQMLRRLSPPPGYTCRRVPRCAASRNPSSAAGTDRPSACRRGSSPWRGCRRSTAPPPRRRARRRVSGSGTRQYTLAPSRWKISCARMPTCTYRSPGGAPCGPASPSPASRMRVPSSTPAGIATCSVRSPCTVPLPWQTLQAFLITRPAPPQVGQVRSTRKKPCCARHLALSAAGRAGRVVARLGFRAGAVAHPRI